MDNPTPFRIRATQWLFVATSTGAIVLGGILLPRAVADGATIEITPEIPIQETIDAADPGDVILFAPGLYAVPSTIILTKPIELRGPQAGVDPRPTFGGTRTASSTAEAILDGNGAIGTILRIEADDVVVDGFEIRNGTGDLIASDASDPIKRNPVIRNSIIHDATGDEGIQLRNAASPIIEYNHIYDTFGDGINICCGSTDGVIRLNEIHDIASPDAAIFIYESLNTTIADNLVYSIPNNDGIKLGDKDGSDAEITPGGSIVNNVVHDTAQDGISVYQSGVTVQDNEIYNSTSANGAINVDFAVSNITISGNYIHDNAFSGASAGGITIREPVITSTISVTNNRLERNTPFGVANHAEDAVAASRNWWGDATGPAASGNGADGNVNFVPWFDAAENGNERFYNILINGDESAPYDSILDAVSAAEDGDVIEVAAGTYSLASKIALAGASTTLRSLNGPESTILDFGGGNCPRVGGRGIALTGDDNVFSGFTVRGCATAAGSGSNYAVVVSGARNTVSNNIVIGDPESLGDENFGIFISGDAAIGTRVTDNTVYDWRTNNLSGGILVGGGGPWAQDTVITGNTVHDNGTYGIVIDRASNTHVTGNEVYANGSAGIYFASRTSGFPATGLITENVVRDNPGNGIRLRGSGVDIAEVTIENNEILNNTTSLLLEGTPSDEVRIRENTVVVSPTGSIAAGLVAAGTDGTLTLGNGEHAGFTIDTDTVTVRGEGATVTGEITISASAVTVQGLAVTNPGGSNGIVVSMDASDITIEENTIDGIGYNLGPAITQNVHGIVINGVSAVRIRNNTVRHVGTDGETVTGRRASGITVLHNANAPVTGIEVYDNTIEDVLGHGSASNKGIFVGSTANPDQPIAGAVLRNNTIRRISANTNPWISGQAAGQGAYGILVNHTATDLRVTDNNTEDLTGFWVHAIGLEGDTPDVIVTGNEIRNLAATKTDPTHDEIGIFFEGNAGAESAVVENNGFENMAFGVATVSGPIDARNNWWGDATGPDAYGSRAGDDVEFAPWLDAVSGSPRLFNVFIDTDGSGTYDEGEPTHASILAALADADAGDTIIVLSGTYPDALTINTPITIAGTPSTKPVITGIGTRTTIAANDVTLRNLVYDLGDDVTTDGVLLINRIGTWPFEIGYSDITFDGIEVYGGRRALYATVNNMTIRSSRFENQARDALFFNAVSGLTLIQDTVFRGDNANKAIIFENFSSGDPATSGTIRILDNTVEGKRNFVVYNQWLCTEKLPDGGSFICDEDAINDPVSLTISGNRIVPFGTAIDIFDPREFGVFDPARFGKISSATIANNAFLTASASAIKAPESDFPSTVDATGNWWGTTNAAAITARIAGPISIDPWFLNAGKTVLSNAIVDGSIEAAGGDFDLEKTTDGEVEIPGNASEIIFGTESALNVTSGVSEAAGGNVTLGGTAHSLTNFTSGTLNNVDFSTPQSVGGQSITVAKAVRLSSGTSTAPVVLKSASVTNANVSIPNATTILAPSTWNGTFQPPRAVAKSGTAPAGFDIGGTVIETGSPDAVLVFDKPVTLTLAGVTGTVGYKSSGSTAWIQITDTCGGTFTSPADPVFPGECAISDGANTKIVTYHLTSFGALTKSGPTGSGLLFATESGLETNSDSAEESTEEESGEVLGTAAFRFTTRLQTGSYGEDVTRLQERLAAERVYFGPVTGYFGPLTRAAIEVFQEKYGINPIGEVGPITRATLNTLETGGEVASVSMFRFTEQLRYGARGYEVIRLQEHLTATGVYAGPITGYFGPLTRAAVEVFQYVNDLPIVGEVGPRTRLLLNE